MNPAEAEEIECFVRLGSVLAGKYQIERVLGMGGMGVVVAARHLQLGERVAIKFLLPRALGVRRSTERFLREARASSKLRGSSVTRVFDTDVRDDGAAFIVMEYLEGESLAAQLRREERLPVASAVDVLLEACTAIAEAHARGIVHRDLKPANLFIARTAGDLKLVKVLDFGISKVLEPESAGDHTTGDSVMGSPPYMSPEQLAKPNAVDHRSDIWSLGVVLYEMLSGKLPFWAGSFAETCGLILQAAPPQLDGLEPALARELDAAVAGCLEKDAARRYPNVLALARVLAPFGSDRARSALSVISAISTPESARPGPHADARSTRAEGQPPTYRDATTGTSPGTGTLTATEHSDRTTGVATTNRLLLALGLGAAALSVWLGSYLLRPRAAPGIGLASAVATTDNPLPPSAAAASPPGPAPAPATISSLPASAAPMVSVGPAGPSSTRTKNKRVVTGLAPGPSAPSTASHPPEDSVFSERH